MEEKYKKITGFIREHHVLTLATAIDSLPYCCSCFYVYLEQENMFVFTSDQGTRHVADIEKNKQVAGAIALETSIVGKIRGLQFTGIIKELKGDELKLAKKAYVKKFPVARLVKLNLWGLTPNFMKLTDNRLGFGKKLIWEK